MSDNEDLLQASFYLTLLHWGQNVNIRTFGVLTSGLGYQCTDIGVLTKCCRHLIIKKCLLTTVAMFFWKSSYFFLLGNGKHPFGPHLCVAIDLRMVSVQLLRSP